MKELGREGRRQQAKGAGVGIGSILLEMNGFRFPCGQLRLVWAG